MTEEKKKYVVPDGFLRFQAVIPESLYVDFLVRIKFDELKKKDFLIEMLRLYVGKDEDFYKILDKIKDKKSRQLKRRREIIRKLRKKEKEHNERFFLSKEEKERIYDILEKDLPTDDID